MKKSISALTLCLGMAVAAFAADPTVPGATQQPLNQQLMSEARSTAKLASDLMLKLKTPDADLSGLSASVETIEKNVAEVTSLVAQLEAKRSTMKPKQLEQLDRIKQLSELMQVYVNQKKEFAAAQNPEARQQMRAYAQMVRDRATLIEKSAQRIGS